MVPNRRPRFYHSGDTAGFDCLARTHPERMPDVTLAALGIWSCAG
jgi:predicted alpha/beta-fold hydrolase